jgi:hypothetical protein
MLHINSNYSNLELFDTCIYRVFHKKMSTLDMDIFFYNKKFEFLVVETFDMRCFEFNLKHEDQRATVKKILQDVNSFIVNGWKVARQIPKWILRYDAWNNFMNEKCSGNKSDSYSEGDNEYDEDNKGEDNEKVEEDEGGQDDEEEEEEDEEEEDEEEEEGEKDEEKEEEEEEKEEKLEEPMTQDDDYNNGKSHQMTDGKLNKNMSKHAVDTVKFSIEDEDVFKSICGGNLRKKMAESNTFKSNSIDIHITGPFFNKKTDKSHWVVVYGDSGKSYVLKPRFIEKYLSCILLDWKKVKNTKVSIDHVSTYYEIGIWKYEFGVETKWKRCNSTDSCKQGPPMKRMSFVYTSDNKDREGLVESISPFSCQ